MVARIQLATKFVVTFWRLGEVYDSRIARDERHATLVAMGMLADIGELRAGDRLDVVAATDGREMPELSRGAHHSG